MVVAVAVTGAAANRLVVAVISRHAAIKAGMVKGELTDVPDPDKNRFPV